jgi:hypothetical protein
MRIYRWSWMTRGRVRKVLKRTRALEF